MNYSEFMNYRYMYYTVTWITQIYGLHKYMNYTGTWITQIYGLHRYINCTDI